MKNFIILLSVIILALTGCGKSGDNKNEEVVLDINSRMGQNLELNKREKGNKEQER